MIPLYKSIACSIHIPLYISHHDTIKKFKKSMDSLQCKRNVCAAVNHTGKGQRSVREVGHGAVLVHKKRGRSTRTVARSIVHKETAPVVESLEHESGTTVSADRRYWSILPPIRERTTKMVKTPRFVCFTQPLRPASFVPDIRLHMYAFDSMEDDSITLVGALAPTGELCEQIKSLGKPVKHIVLPSSSPEHWLYGPALSKVFPDALVWVVPGFMEGKGVPLPGRSLLFRDVHGRDMLRELPNSLESTEGHPEFPQGIRAIILDVPLFIEAAIVVESAKAVVLSDTGICLSADDPEYKEGVNIGLAEAAGIWDRLGPITRVVQEKYDEKAREWCDAILTEDFDTVLLSHGSPVVQDCGKESFRECFDFLYN